MGNIFLIILIVVPSFCFADMGTCYCVEAQIENSKGEIQNGYFTIEGYKFYIERQGGEYVYSTKLGWVKLPLISDTDFNFELKYEAKFSDYIRSLVGDTLKYYPDMLKIQYKVNENTYQQIKLLGTETVILSQSIKSIKIKKLMGCGVGAAILTHIEHSDKEWIKSTTKIEPLGGTEMCGYTAIHFSQSPEDTEKLLNELRKTIIKYNDSLINYDAYSKEYRDNISNEISKHITSLKNGKIIVLIECSC